jgi:hypothetical protein
LTSDALDEDLPLALLDDRADRAELRSRYYGLLQELRVILPGAQILVAFLLTAPFSGRFGDLDSTGRFLYGVALGSGAMSIIAFTTPTAIHRFGPRQSRRGRLRWGINLTRFGLIMVAISLASAISAVYRFVFSPGVGNLAAVVTFVTLAALWVGLPALTGRLWRRDNQPLE